MDIDKFKLASQLLSVIDDIDVNIFMLKSDVPNLTNAYNILKEDGDNAATQALYILTDALEKKLKSLKERFDSL